MHIKLFTYNQIVFIARERDIERFFKGYGRIKEILLKV